MKDIPHKAEARLTNRKILRQFLPNHHEVSRLTSIHLYLYIYKKAQNELLLTVKIYQLKSLS